MSIRSRRYNILNKKDLHNAINNVASDIGIGIENKNPYRSDLKLHKINKTTIHYDKYVPTRADRLIELPQRISKVACYKQ